MKLAAVSMVKNECDIIELFIKINSRTFDHLYIIDHCSDDKTVEIINKLQAAGFPVSLLPTIDNDFNQADILTKYAKNIARQNTFDYIMPLDADEFLATETPEIPIKETIAAHLSINKNGLIPWKTYCPVSDTYYQHSAPLFENFRMRKREPLQYYKTILGNNFAKTCRLSEGSHFAKNRSLATRLKKVGYEINKLINPKKTRANFHAPEVLPLIIQHVPVRSSAQIIRKAILGSHTFAMKKGRKKGEGFHWDDMARKIRNDDYTISYPELVSIALHYSTPDDDRSAIEIAEDGPRIGLASDRLEMKELATIRPLQSFDAYISGLVSRLHVK